MMRTMKRMTTDLYRDIEKNMKKGSWRGALLRSPSEYQKYNNLSQMATLALVKLRTRPVAGSVTVMHLEGRKSRYR